MRVFSIFSYNSFSQNGTIHITSPFSLVFCCGLCNTENGHPLCLLYCMWYYGTLMCRHIKFNCWAVTEPMLHQIPANTLSNNNTKSYKYFQIIAVYNPREATRKQINMWTNEAITPDDSTLISPNGATGCIWRRMKIGFPIGSVIGWKWIICIGAPSVMTAPYCKGPSNAFPRGRRRRNLGRSKLKPTKGLFPSMK